MSNTVIHHRTADEYSLLNIVVNGIDSIAPTGPAAFEDVYLGDLEWDIILGSRLHGERIISISVMQGVVEVNGERQWDGKWQVRWTVSQEACGGWSPSVTRRYEMPLDGPDVFEIRVPA